MSERGDARVSDKAEVEEEYEDETECNECGGLVDILEAGENDGVCFDCNAKIRVARLREWLPSSFCARQVARHHRKPCSDCGKGDWSRGDWYIANSVHKYCLECAERKFWEGDGDSDADDEGFTNFTEFMCYYGNVLNKLLMNELNIAAGLGPLYSEADLQRMNNEAGLGPLNNEAGQGTKRSADSDGSNVSEPPTMRRRI